MRRGSLDLESIRARYPKEIIEKMLTLGSNIIAEGSIGVVPYATELRLTKKKNADFSVRIASDVETTATIAKEATLISSVLVEDLNQVESEAMFAHAIKRSITSGAKYDNGESSN